MIKYVIYCPRKFLKTTELPPIVHAQRKSSTRVPASAQSCEHRFGPPWPLGWVCESHLHSKDVPTCLMTGYSQNAPWSWNCFTVPSWERNSLNSWMLSLKFGLADPMSEILDEPVHTSSVSGNKTGLMALPSFLLSSCYPSCFKSMA